MVVSLLRCFWRIESRKSALCSPLYFIRFLPSLTWKRQNLLPSPEATLRGHTMIVCLQPQDISPPPVSKVMMEYQGQGASMPTGGWWFLYARAMMGSCPMTWKSSFRTCFSSSSQFPMHLHRATRVTQPTRQTIFLPNRVLALGNLNCSARSMSDPTHQTSFIGRRKRVFAKPRENGARAMTNERKISRKCSHALEDFIVLVSGENCSKLLGNCTVNIFCWSTAWFLGTNNCYTHTND